MSSTSELHLPRPVMKQSIQILSITVDPTISSSPAAGVTGSAGLRSDHRYRNPPCSDTTECTGLENRSTLTGTQGSNPCLSAFMNAEKHSVFAETPSFLGVSLRLRPRLWAALICTQSCNSVQTCANPCELYGTIRGTSAPLTAPFFRRFSAPRRSEKPVHYRGSAPAQPAVSKSQVSPERRCEPCTPKTRLTRGQEYAPSSIASNLPSPVCAEASQVAIIRDGMQAPRPDWQRQDGQACDT